VLVGTVSATDKGSSELVSIAIAVLHVDRNEMSESNRSDRKVGTGANVEMNPVMPDDVDTSTLVLNAVAHDNVLLAHAGENGLVLAALLIIKAFDDVNTSEVAALVVEDARTHCTGSA